MGNVVVKDLNMLDHIMNEMVKVPRGGGGFLRLLVPEAAVPPQ